MSTVIKKRLSDHCISHLRIETIELNIGMHQMRSLVNLIEAFLTELGKLVTVNDERFVVLINPSAKQVLDTLAKSRTDELKGVVIGKTMYWWDSYMAHHGHILKLFDPNYPRPYATDGVDQRMNLRVTPECEAPTLDCDLHLLDHPQVQRLLSADTILYRAPGMGCVTYSEYRSANQDPPPD